MISNRRAVSDLLLLDPVTMDHSDFAKRRIQAASRTEFYEGSPQVDKIAQRWESFFRQANKLSTTEVKYSMVFLVYHFVLSLEFT